MVRSPRKNYITFFLIYACAVITAHAGNDEELFLRGNKYYAEKEYDNAFSTYNMMSKKGRAVVYNMGNCLFYTHDYPRALVYWSRAESGATPDECAIIARNKRIALEKLGKQQEMSWWQQFIELIRVHLLFVPLFFLQLFFVMCVWLCSVVMPQKQTGLKKMLKSFVCFCALLSMIALGMHYARQNICSAIVVRKDAKLFAGPDTSFHVLCPVAYADCARVTENREGWYKIQYAGVISSNSNIPILPL